MLKVIEGGTPPKIKTKYSSSADLCSRVDIVIGAGETKIIPLGVKIDLDEMFQIFNDDVFDVSLKKYEYDDSHTAFDDFLKSHFMELKLRSSLALEGLIIANGVGEIDFDYPDEIGLIVHNPITAGLPFRVVKKLKHNSNEIESEHIQYLAGEINIKAGERVAQIKLMEHKNYLLPDRFKNNTIRTGGFGSTN